MKKDKAFVLDLDDTIVNFGGCLTRLFNSKNGTSLTEYDLVTWDFKDIEIKDARGNIAKGSELRKFFIEYEKHGLYTVLPILPESSQAISFLHELGYKIIIMTARNEKFKIQTEMNLIMNNIQCDELIFHWDKVKEINKLKKKFDIVGFVDDKISTVEAVKDKCELSFNFLITKAYNATLPVAEGITRVHNILEMIRFLK